MGTRLGILGLLVLCGCAALLDVDDGADDSSSSGGSSGAGDDDDVSSSGGSSGAPTSSSGALVSSSGGVSTLASYSKRRAELEVLRQQGPVTPQNSTGHCTPSRFVWRESDGTVHSWSGIDQSTLDYAFKVSTPAYAFRASDHYLVTATASFDGLDVFRADTEYEKVTTLPYSAYYGASGDGVLRIEWSDPETSRVSRWTENGTSYVSSPFPSRQPHSSIDNGTMVVPAGVNAPYLLNLIFDDGTPSTSVLFAGAASLQASLPTPRGLLVWYARNGNNSALRLYRDNSDSDQNRYEIGDELANRDPYFNDIGPHGHEFFNRIAFYGDSWVIYTSIFGIWAYHTETAELRPLQLGAQDRAYTVDVLCVMQEAGLLAYRDMTDAAGRIWVVPLAELLAD